MDERMKRIAFICKFLILLAAISCLTANPLIRNTSAAGNPEDVVFYVDPENSTARVGDYFTIDLRVKDAFYIYSWQVVIMWTDTVLSGVEVIFGGFLADQPEGSSTNLDSSRTYMWIIGESTLGKHMGRTGDGLLFSMTFQVVGEGSSALTIDSSVTYYNYMLVPPTSVKVEDFHKENGNFVPTWLEDLNADGIIDIGDISMIGIDWGACTVQTNNPSTTSGGWTSGSSAYISDDSYASAASAGLEQVYGGYGFATGTWTSVTKVEVGLERKTDSGGNDDVTIAVSNNGGDSWSGTTVTVDVTELTDTFTWYDFTAAYSWTPSGVADIAVQITYGKSGGTATPIYVDWLPVRVTPEPQAISPYTDLSGNGLVWIEDLSTVALQFGEKYAG